MNMKQIKTFKNLQDAVDQMMSPEKCRLSTRCNHCNGSLRKRSSVTKWPLVLTVTLIRFDEQLRKIDDFFEFPEVLEVNDGEIEYELYGMIVHEGRVINHGHFFAYVKNEDGAWFKSNDVCVFKVNPEVVMSARPYVLFYKQII